MDWSLNGVGDDADVRARRGRYAGAAGAAVPVVAFAVPPAHLQLRKNLTPNACTVPFRRKGRVLGSRRFFVVAESDYAADDDSETSYSGTTNHGYAQPGTARGFGVFTRSQDSELERGRGRRQQAYRLLSDSRTFRFYDYLREAHFPKVALAEVPVDGASSLKMRGLVATAAIRAGEVICRIPRRLAICLGSEGENPGLPALHLLRMMTDGEAVHKYKAYFDVLPRPEMCQMTTDFYNDEELGQIAHTPTVKETRRRRQQLRDTFLQEFLRTGADYLHPQVAAQNLDHMPEFQRYLWAVHLVVSRALAVRTGDEAQRYLIPLLDMINCRMDSKHELRYRIATDEFVLIAGESVRRSEEIRIPYGGGFVSNDRLIQDYGFIVERNPADLLLFLPRHCVQRADLLSSEERENVRQECAAVLARQQQVLSVPSERIRAFNRAVVDAARKCIELLETAEEIQS